MKLSYTISFLFVTCLIPGVVRITRGILLILDTILIKIHGEQCLSDQWPPKPDRVLPTYVVNLDAPPIERWKDVAAAYKIK
jgi:hypothetical protein